MYIYFMYFFYVYYRKDRVIIANGKKFRKRWFTRTAKLYKVFVRRNISHDFFNVTKHITAIVRTQENMTEY